MIRKHWLLLTLLVIMGIAVWLRLFNLSERLYFIYDQGRDALKLREILQGDLTLVGPTSGLAGFFLGPLWYYAGVPGFILSQGNPYYLSLWYILLGSLSLPLFWLISKKLFPLPWSLLSFALLSWIPGAVHGTIFIWNPLLSLPLMAGSFLGFLHARNSRIALGIGFLLLALTLQSEFAYAVFFIGPLFLLIPWLRQKVDWRDFAISAIAIGVTLVPQALFELKNNFILTNSLLTGVTQGEGGISLLELWQFRPQQLFDASAALLLGYPPERFWLMLPLLISLVVGIGGILCGLSIKNFLHPNLKQQAQLLLLLFFGLPYVGYLLWTGNQGNFFDYYITSHFIFIVPVIVLGWQTVWHHIHHPLLKRVSQGVVVLGLGIWLACIGKYAYDFVIHPVNNAGLRAMQRAVIQLFTWRDQAGENSDTMLVFTPGYQNEQYDYLIYWLAKSHEETQPIAVRSGEEENWFLLMERNESDISKFRFEEWYPVATAGGELVERKQVGILELEWWQKASP